MGKEGNLYLGRMGMSPTLPMAVADDQAITPEHKVVSPTDKTNHVSSPLIDYCRSQPALQHLSDESSVTIGPLPPFFDLNDLPRQFWPGTCKSSDPFSIPRKPLKSQNDAFDVSGYKTARNQAPAKFQVKLNK